MGISVFGPIDGPWGVQGPCDLLREHVWPDMRLLLAIKGTYFSNSGVAGNPFSFSNRFLMSRNIGENKKKVCSDRSMPPRDISLKKLFWGPQVGF